MSDETNKKEPVLEVPFWFLQISSKINRNQRRFVFKIIYGIVGIYALIPLFQSLLTGLPNKNYEIFYYYYLWQENPQYPPL